jgi:hypothetical protein
LYFENSATGQSAQASTSQDSVIQQRQRCRIQLDDSKDIDDSNIEVKQPRIQKATQGAAALEIIVSVLQDQQAGGRKNKVEIAVELLENEYQDRLSKEHFIDALNFLTDVAKVSLFITLKSSSIRGRWLCQNANIELI